MNSANLSAKPVQEHASVNLSDSLQPRARELQVSFGGYSSTGVKPINQDAFAAAYPDNASRRFKGAAAAIADGGSSSGR